MWKYRGSAEILSQHFGRHLLGLLVSYKSKGQEHHSFFTGFLLDYKNLLLWITVGHVVDQIVQILLHDSVEITRIRWADGCELSGAESIPVHKSELLGKTFSIKNTSMDFGAIAISSLAEINIRKNNRSIIMDERVWKNIHLSKPDGYYVLGFPEPWFSVSPLPTSTSSLKYMARANISCLPVERIIPDHQREPTSFWGDTEAFYGHIVPFLDSPEGQPETIVGMSGGSLFSIEQDENSQIRYYLYGIQKDWLKNQKIVRADPIHRILSIIEN